MDSPSSRARLRLILEVLLIVVICVALVILGASFGVFDKPVDEHQVTFRVTGGGGYVNITYSTSGDKDPVSLQVSTPWEMTAVIKTSTQVYLTAANASQTGEIGCALLLDHNAWKNESVRAPSTNVACGGIVP